MPTLHVVMPVYDEGPTLAEIVRRVLDAALPAGWSVVVSLHATKVLGAGEGGIVVFGDVESADRFRAFTNLGFERTRTSERHGVNGKLPEATAAYALAALDGWELEEQQWRAARALARAAESRRVSQRGGARTCPWRSLAPGGRSRRRRPGRARTSR